MRSVYVEILMQTALTGVIVDAKLSGSSGKALMGIVADGAVAHGGEHDRHIQFQLWCQFANQIALCVPFQPVRFLTEENFCFHRLPEGINGRIRDLGRIDQDLIPVYREFLGVTHGRKQHTAGICLLIKLLDGFVAPVCIFPECAVIFHDFQRTGRTQRNTALAVNALGLIAEHQPPLRIKGMYLIGTLPLANTAGNASTVVSDDLKFRVNEFHAH